MMRRRKSLEQVQREAEGQTLRRALGRGSLVFLGVGCIIGSGIFVLTGSAAAQFAGPAVVLSFVFAGLACALTGLCYAELAAAMPVAGSAYSYSYASVGEVAAWVTGWLMLLEYGVANALVASGFSGYLTSLLRDLGIIVPAALSTPWIDGVRSEGGLTFASGPRFNLVASLGVLFATAVLTRGVHVSAGINSLIVVLKIAVLLLFAVVGAAWIDPQHWTPFIPANEGGFAFGWPGVFRAASVIFFAYFGFEVVSTACAEAKNPQRDVPFGILGSLIICTLIYVAVAAVLTGVVPFRSLAVPDPLAVAADAMNLPAFAVLIKVGAVTGLTSVMLVTLYGQTRIFYAMSRDGLLPPLFGTVHPRLRTPYSGTLVVGATIALVAGVLPIPLLSDLVSLGVAVAFGMVCFSVLWLRSTQPELERPFLVPWGGLWIGRWWLGFVPTLGMLFCLLMALPLIADLSHRALNGDMTPALLLAGYVVLGAAIYVGYGRRHSKLAQRLRTGASEAAHAEG